MAKPKGKKKKGAKKKKVQEVDPNLLTEVDKTFYELTITDLNRKLARLRSLTTELEDKNTELNQQLEKLDEDRSDIIIYLKRMLQEKSDEIAELEERITALQETRQNETEQFEEKIQELENEYKQMHETLTSENKLLEGKLNSLEEFRAQRDELLKKYEDQENALEEQENRHKRELYEIEKKFIISKDKLKRDMEARLLQLSTEFQDAQELRIAATTHRVIRENIAVNNELDIMLKAHQRLNEENENMKQRTRQLRQEASLYEAEKKQALSKAHVQLKVIERLTEENGIMAANIENFKKIQAELSASRTQLKQADEKVKNLEQIIRILEQNLHASRCERVSVTTDYLYMKEDNKRLSDILYNAVSTIRSAISASGDSDLSLRTAKRENFLQTLLSLLSKAKQKLKQPSLDTIDCVDAGYTRGDLGFVPKPVVLRSQFPVKKHMDTQTGSSLEELMESVEGESNEDVAEPTSVVSVVSSFSKTDKVEDEASIIFFDEVEDIGEEEEELEVDMQLEKFLDEVEPVTEEQPSSEASETTRKSSTRKKSASSKLSIPSTTAEHSTVDVSKKRKSSTKSRASVGSQKSKSNVPLVSTSRKSSVAFALEHKKSSGPIQAEAKKSFSSNVDVASDVKNPSVTFSLNEDNLSGTDTSHEQVRMSIVNFAPQEMKISASGSEAQSSVSEDKKTSMSGSPEEEKPTKDNS